MSAPLAENAWAWLESEAPLSQVAFLCDLDGTLLEFADRPEDVRIPEGLIDLLNQLHRGLHGAFAIVSGRGMEDLGQLLRGYEGVRAGLHGGQIEMPDNATSPVTTADDGLPALPQAMAVRLHVLLDDFSGLRIEHKPPCIAIHHTLSMYDAARLELCIKMLMVPLPDWQILQGRRVIEIRPVAANKGAAVDRLMRLPPFAGRIPVCLGDDTTDIDMFEAARNLGGISIGVGPRTRDTARWSLDTPAETRRWLAMLARRLMNPLS